MKAKRCNEETTIPTNNLSHPCNPSVSPTLVPAVQYGHAKMSISIKDNIMYAWSEGHHDVFIHSLNATREYMTEL